MPNNENEKQRGGGPKTARGKSISRWNAMKHGATAKQLFMPDAKHRPQYEKYRQLCEELQEELAPGAYLEDKIAVQKFIADVIMLERFHELQLRLLPDEKGGNALELAPNSMRYLKQAQRNFKDSRQQIQEIRARAEYMLEAAEIETTPEEDNLTCVPASEQKNGVTKTSQQHMAAPEQEEV